MTVQYELEFCDATSIIGNNNTLTRGTTNYKANAATNKGCFPGNNANIAAEIGGSVFHVELTTAMTAAMSAVAYLATHSTNTLTSGNNLASINLAANEAAGTRHSVKLGKGTKRAAYLGVVVVGTGNIAAGAINAYLTSAGEVVD
jgi:hypothetical protein